ncbi:LysM peptidoglycan-binding domain-containing protein [Actinomadura welshii]
MKRHRSAGDVIAGIGALAALAVLLAGVPVALLVLFGSPLPDEVPSTSDLTRRVGPGALIGILVALVWLAWLQFAACVVVEVYAGIRGVGVPARVPLAGGTQSLVHRLVVAALLLFTATTAIMPAFAAGGLSQSPPAQTQAQEFRPVSATTPERTAADAGERPGDPAAEPMQKAATTKIYRVQPPEGRHHESLWEIAEKCLGEGRRYKEIFALNKGHIQPDGTRLTIASLIRPGWILEMPADAKGAKVIPAEDLDEYFRYGHAVPDGPEKPGKPEKPEKPERPQQPAPPSASQPPATQAPPTTAPPTAPPSAQPSAPPSAAPEQSAPQTPEKQQPEKQQPGEGRPEKQQPAQPPVHGGGPSGEISGGADSGGASVPGQGSDRQEETGGAFDVGWPHGLAASALLAAGLLVALGRRRRVQLWHRAFGKMIVRPEGAAAEAERALRLGADDESARLLDLGLRHLSKSMAAGGRSLPTVYGVHLGGSQAGPGSLDLWIAPADRNPPAPWQAFDDGQVWRLHSDALAELEAADLGDVLAPYPGLVSIGTNDNGRILVDLEAAHGLIALRGPEDVRRAALSAIAMELATNRWSDHMRITLVGFDGELGEGLTEIAPDRIRAVPTLAEALPELEARSEEVRQALAASGVDSVLTGRCRGVFGEAWMPHYLIMADRPSERDADRLVALARTGAPGWPPATSSPATCRAPPGRGTSTRAAASAPGSSASTSTRSSSATTTTAACSSCSGPRDGSTRSTFPASPAGRSRPRPRSRRSTSGCSARSRWRRRARWTTAAAHSAPSCWCTWRRTRRASTRRCCPARSGRAG